MKNNPIKSPLTIHLVDPTKHFTLCIALDGKVIHHIPNIRSFIRHLGYPDIVPSVLNSKPSITKNKNLFNNLKHIDVTEEVDYKSDNCLQYKIKEYLYQNNELYREQCGERFEKLIGSCKSLKIENSNQCENCIMLKNN
jgi:hypothetical protein